MDTIIVQKRDLAAKAKQLRRCGIVPCVIYGGGLKESLSVQMDQGTARRLKQTKRNGSKVNVQVENQTYPTLIQDLEYNVRNDEIVHISFYVLDAGKKINSVADIVLVNQDKLTGVLEQIQMRIPHAATPEYLLDTVAVDLEQIPVGTALTIGDIPAFNSDKIELLADPSSIVLRVNDKKRLGTQTEG